MNNQNFFIVFLAILSMPSVIAVEVMCANGYWPSRATIEGMSATQVVECWGSMLWDFIYFIIGIVLISVVADLRHAYIMSLTGTTRRIKVQDSARIIIPPDPPEVPPSAPTET